MTPEPSDAAAAPTPGSEQEARLRRILVRVWNPAQPTRMMLAGENDPPEAEPLVLPDGVFAALIAEAGAQDGDEIEILVRRTGHRPWGPR